MRLFMDWHDTDNRHVYEVCIIATMIAFGILAGGFVLP